MRSHGMAPSPSEKETMYATRAARASHVGCWSLMWKAARAAALTAIPGTWCVARGVARGVTWGVA